MEDGKGGSLCKGTKKVLIDGGEVETGRTDVEALEGDSVGVGAKLIEGSTVPKVGSNLENIKHNTTSTEFIFILDLSPIFASYQLLVCLIHIFITIQFWGVCAPPMLRRRKLIVFENDSCGKAARQTCFHMEINDKDSD